MNDAVEVLVPAFAFCMFLALVFGFLAFLRYLRYKETIALAERGLLRPLRRKTRVSNTLRWGIMLFMTGIGLTIGLAIIDSAVVIPGILATFFGLSLMVIHWVTKDSGLEEVDELANGEEPIPPHKL